MILAFENECIPANLNLKQIKSSIAKYCPPLKPITQNYKYKPGIHIELKIYEIINRFINNRLFKRINQIFPLLGLVSINNFGIGGANGNVLLKPNHKLSDENSLKIAEQIPRIVNICGRTEEAINFIFDFIEKNPQKISRDFLALFGETMKIKLYIKSMSFPFRGILYNNVKFEENLY